MGKTLLGSSLLVLAICGCDESRHRAGKDVAGAGAGREVRDSSDHAGSEAVGGSGGEGGESSDNAGSTGDGSEAVGGSGGEGGESSDNAGSTGDGSGGSDAGTAVWTAASSSVSISWFSFWDGGYRFERTREQLDARQLALLEALHTIETTGNCPADIAEVKIVVTDDDGSTREFSAADTDGPCTSSDAVVDYAKVEDFLGTVSCVSAKGYDGSSLDSAPTVSVDDGCYHGLFNNEDKQAWWFLIEVPSADEYRFTVEECRDRELELSLFDESATENVGGVESVEDGCAQLTVSIDEPGTYALFVRWLSGTIRGDFYLRATSGDDAP